MSSSGDAHQPGIAGASARREYERRSTARDARIRAAHPRIGGLILALSEEPQSTRAWERGAIGEELLAERLRDLPDSFRVLHDRRIPGTRANIDHLVVGPGGVWVVDAKRYVGQRPSLDVEGGILRPRVESLRIGGRDRTKLIEGVRGQVALVVGTIDDSAVPVTGALCFLDGDWPLIGGSFRVNEIEVLWPRLLVKRMIDSATVPIDVARTVALLAARFPHA
ncbi:nuclease-related domain-containing protein [Microbacterium sp. ASV49]